ncbi:AraC family transcriptional regulator [Azorhizobium oxalatiphilum]|uniref:AraC family transcriptional regulator n=1 Tax=Azorhizobium oxalatiphilum TaxID=980631 RepID=A0A917FHM9_9HYPH|nr:GlxA family transcriptional regulator [Azorhizobium oxalatiphilum]GGF81944.1 AraC family transcriptional regulator [Azorhizobium oxalatiphilum]
MKMGGPQTVRGSSRRSQGGARLRVGFLLMHNFTLTAFSSFVDVLRLAADEGDRSRPIACSWQVMSPGCRPVRSSCGVEIQPNADLMDPANFDYVVVVGGLLHGMPPLPRAMAPYLERAALAGVTLAGVCTGSFVLSRLGLMGQRKCCVSWYHYRDFLDEFPALVPVADRLFVEDGDRITCSGGAGVADLAAHLVSRHLGASAAQKALNILLIDRPRAAESAQPAPPITEGIGPDDDRVSRALLMMEQHLAEPLAVARIAARLGLSTRQLERLFTARLGETPQESYLALRLRHGRWMLAHTVLPAAQIAVELGFADGSHFGRAFKARYAMTPTAFRRTHTETVGAGAPDAVPRVYG